jgi:hypothetical protein
MSVVEEIRQLLGEEVVLIKVAQETKQPTLQDWPQLSPADMTREYLRELEYTNIGVLLAQLSQLEPKNKVAPWGTVSQRAKGLHHNG